MDYVNYIIEYIEKEKKILDKLNINEINDFINAIVNAYEQEADIYIFGNGGSAATASHYTNDFNKGISEYTNRKFRFVCLNDNISTIMAIANDISYEEVFRFQLEGRLKANDIVIGISGSGNSKNVINAIEYANINNVKTIGVTGYSGGALKNIVDISMNVPVHDMQITEDIHMILDHLMMSVLMKVWKLR